MNLSNANNRLTMVKNAAFNPEDWLDLARHHRRHLHSIPELGFDLYQTQAYLISVLAPLGYSLKTVAQTGLIAVREGKTAQTLVVRAEMDALPIHESNDVPYRSKHPQRMHACGHDGHMAMALVLAAWAVTVDHPLSLCLVFEPAEETEGGGKFVVADATFRHLNIGAMLALHLDPQLPFGQCASRPGIMTAQDGDLDITLFGKSAHGATPHHGINALLAASDVVQACASLNRLEGTLKDRLVNVGLMAAGDGRNIVPSQAHLQGTLRAYEPQAYEGLLEAIDQVLETVKSRYGVTHERTLQTLHPPVINDAALFRIAEEILGPHLTVCPPMLIAEDFSYYQHHHPGLFIMLGTGEGDAPTSLHSDTFDFDESILTVGVATYVRFMDYFLHQWRTTGWNG